MTFKQQIRAHRLRRRLSQRKFAALLNVNPSTVSLWERGLRTPHAITRSAILRRLEVAQR